MSNTKKYFMGIDIGTYQSKGIIIDGMGQAISKAFVEHEMDNPQSKYFEHDAEKIWWKDFCYISKKLLNKSKISSKNIGCIGASTLGSDCLPVDKNCIPLRKAILYGIDARAQKEIEFLTSYYGEKETEKMFGRPICSGDVGPKILWIKNNEPEIYKKTYKFLTGTSFIVARLTGEYVVDKFLCQASFRPLYNLDGTKNEKLCSQFCRPDQLAEAKNVNEVAGYISRKASYETGLAEGTPVITGTGDSCAEAISTGVLQPGDLMIQMGSSLFFYCCTDRLVLDKKVRGNTFTIPGMYSVAAGTNTAGTLTRWYKDELFKDLAMRVEINDSIYDAMVQDFDNIPPGSGGLITLPYFAGERTPINDPDAKGMIFGLRLDHTRAHLYKSALESIGYSISQHLDIFQECGIQLNKIYVTGGGTKNKIWLQIVSDIVGKELLITKETIGASFGDALLASMGCGYVKKFSDLQKFISLDTTIIPNADNNKKYQKYKKIYRQLYDNNKTLMHVL